MQTRFVGFLVFVCGCLMLASSLGTGRPGFTIAAAVVAFAGALFTVSDERLD